VRRVARGYVDTSVISALFDERNPERRRLTEMFFGSVQDMGLYLSEITITELERTPDLVKRRRMRDEIPRYTVLAVTEDIKDLANDYILHGAVPERYREDAYHIAIAVSNDMDFLLSWNFDHIVRRRTKDIVRMVNSLHGIGQVEILTPAELL